MKDVGSVNTRAKLSLGHFDWHEFGWGFIKSEERPASFRGEVPASKDEPKWRPRMLSDDNRSSSNTIREQLEVTRCKSNK